MLEVTFDQIVGIATSILVTMGAAIGFLVKWILSKFTDLENKLVKCEALHLEGAKTQARLEGRLEEMERLTPANVAAQIVEILVAKKPKAKK